MVLGRLIGVEVIPSANLWVGAGISGFLVVGTLVNSSFVFFFCFLAAFPSLAGLSLDLWDAMDSSSFSKLSLKWRDRATLD